MKNVLLLHAPPDAARAQDVAATLVALGYAVRVESCGAIGFHGRRRLAGAAQASPKVLLLWSRAATPSLRVAAAAARRAGKLACARLDASLPPARLASRAVGLPPGRAQRQALRRLFDGAVGTAPQSKQGIKARAEAHGGATALAVLLLGLATAWAAYAAIPDFAVRVNGLVGAAQAMAHSVRR
jgi:hypothetical protein